MSTNSNLIDYDLLDRSRKCIAQGALTNSKRSSTFVEGVYPVHVDRGQGCYLIDRKGNRFTDFICGLGSNLFGYADVEISQAIINAVRSGLTLSLGSTLEVEYAEAIKGIFPFIDHVKILKTGTEATSSAIKIARAYHGANFKEMSEMRTNVANKLFSFAQLENWEAQRALQILYQGIPISAKGNENKEIGSMEIRSNVGWEGCGAKALTQTTRENKGTWTARDLQHGETKTSETTLRSLRGSEGASPSRRLYEAIRREMVMSATSCGCAPSRCLILSDAYHGHHDSFISLTEPALGVTVDPFILPLIGNEDLISEAAGVIIEPVITDFSDERKAWLKALRERCTQVGALLIFDEVITGFRFPKWSVSQYFGIEPDLIVLGKAIGGGMPLAVVGGKKKIMNDVEYFVSSTFAGERASIAAGLKVIQLLKSKRKIDDLWVAGELFQRKFNKLHSELKIEGYPTRGVFKGNELVKALFFQEACKAHMLFGPSFFFNFHHIPLIDDVISACKDIMTRIKTGAIELEGAMPSTPFAQKQRE